MQLFRTGVCQTRMMNYYPDKTEFKRRARQGDLTPVYAEILADMETPVSAFRKITRTGRGGGQDNKGKGLYEAPKYAFLLESVEGGERIARYSFLGCGADRVIKTKSNLIELTRDGETLVQELLPGQDPLDVLKSELHRLRYVADPDLPRFCGGAVGFIGYDMVRFFEKLPDNAVDDLNLPDCFFVFTDTLLIFDHVKHRIRVVCNARVGNDPDKSYDEAVAKIDSVVQLLTEPIVPSESRSQVAASPISSNFTRQDFERAVRKCKDYIAAGDAIQIVLSQRFKTDVLADSFDVYRALRSLNPSPYMYYLNYDNITLIGSSPEILVTEERGKVTVRPIAGTRRRGLTEEEDKQLEQELLRDEKELAEHIMLVDLGRNDIGRVCQYGSVQVTELMTIERYSHVMHIVSNVVGRLRVDADQFDLLRACFPAGTVSGAPKVRAMEIIDELEPTRRGVYAGCTGYFSYSGDMDMCITIRTILMLGNTAYVQAGAGIVADSDPAREYDETVNKAMALTKAIELAQLGLSSR
ncbi:MAG: anthranilate synthase component I [Armatimonadota bacterium]|nr:anthranilate synthase component I [Armatimonadota bacterium]